MCLDDIGLGRLISAESSTRWENRHFFSILWLKRKLLTRQCLFHQAGCEIFTPTPAKRLPLSEKWIDQKPLNRKNGLWGGGKLLSVARGKLLLFQEKLPLYRCWTDERKSWCHYVPKVFFCNFWEKVSSSMKKLQFWKFKIDDIELLSAKLENTWMLM